MASTKSKQDVLIDELLQDCPDPKDILGKNGLLKQLTKRLVERTLKAELKVTNCDLKDFCSSWLSRNMKSDGNLERFRLTTCFRTLVPTP
jgi:hypothetical protein